MKTYVLLYLNTKMTLQPFIELHSATQNLMMKVTSFFVQNVIEYQYLWDKYYQRFVNRVRLIFTTGVVLL